MMIQTDVLYVGTDSDFSAACICRCQVTQQSASCNMLNVKLSFCCKKHTVSLTITVQQLISF